MRRFIVWAATWSPKLLLFGGTSGQECTTKAFLLNSVLQLESWTIGFLMQLCIQNWMISSRTLSAGRINLKALICAGIILKIKLSKTRMFTNPEPSEQAVCIRAFMLPIIAPTCWHWFQTVDFRMLRSRSVCLLLRFGCCGPFPHIWPSFHWCW